MHTLSSTFVLGYHGCDESVAETLLAGADFRKSDNDYDWLGPGIYFWEANPRRALEFAQEIKDLRRGPKIERPAAIGAVIELGLCLDLTTTAGIEQVKIAHARLTTICAEAGWTLPRNSSDRLRRNLDCAVVRTLHEIRIDGAQRTIDTVKGVFVEGGPAYPESGFYDKTHIQICVCEPERIKGVFRVPDRFLR